MDELFTDLGKGGERLLSDILESKIVTNENKLHSDAVNKPLVDWIARRSFDYPSFYVYFETGVRGEKSDYVYAKSVSNTVLNVNPFFSENIVKLFFGHNRVTIDVLDVEPAPLDKLVKKLVELYGTFESVEHKALAMDSLFNKLRILIANYTYDYFTFLLELCKGLNQLGYTVTYGNRGRNLLKELHARNKNEETIEYTDLKVVQRDIFKALYAKLDDKFLAKLL